MTDGAGLTIGVLGSYGGRNLGDEAILTGLLSDLREIEPNARIIVFSRNPAHTALAHPDVEAVPWEGVSRADSSLLLADLDVLILGGGGILYNREARRYLRVVRVAQERGLPLLTYAVGVGPLSDTVDTGMVRETLAGATEVTVRDQESRMVLEEAGLLNPITVTADPAFLLEPDDFPESWLRDEGVPAGKRLVGLSVREPGRAAERLDVDGYHRLLAQIGDFLVHRIDAYVLFVPMERDDIRHSHGVMSHMTTAERGRVLHGDYSPRQVLGLMRHFDLAVGMRLHFLIFAAMVGTPFLPLPYAGKVFDLAQRLGVPALRGVEREVEGPLLAEVDRLWDEREARAEQTAQLVAEVCDQARATSQVTRGVLESIRSRTFAPAAEVRTTR
ncbi:polysaccharide pyruvyl transferase CsaB [Micromonospora viridifaciens]|uniref:Polysaccharide pyruvyl transferase CsaB n=1 Tax=Micromonospora viridifaciens TaxID=1881 RepID=A0A1C4VW78_MICVI|nr:polysaccharide pyruvyl transferase family protein [Micromonospora viridifaciens]SCE88031.1 polysaccharide pyruvyl transferase CsaB [Micromonospora viridifaciens]